jgi:hypothetical protein
VRQPEREDVAKVWQAVIDGTMTREDAHAWAGPFVEGNQRAADPSAGAAVTWLHGFDLARPIGETAVSHGLQPGYEYVCTVAEIAALLDA